MARYAVRLRPRARKQLARLPSRVQKRLGAMIDLLELEPRPPGVVRMKGRGDMWRVRVGDYRIVYRVEDEILLVLVIHIGHRRDVYRRLD